jgi:hypothetical protein
MVKKWFQKAVMKKSPYTLGGWKKNQSPKVRRAHALSSRPKNWTLKKRFLSAGRALMALSNVTKDKATEMKARADAMYFFRKLK